VTLVEPYRPALHFSPRAGWINDPNGLIFIDGRWHLFYQHEPNQTVHGPMHLGHASSTDLTTWTEHPVALYPDDLGTCFSGSAIETAGGEVKLFYTAHRKTPDGTDFQTQCLVHADRGLTRFVSDRGNPVVDNPGLEAFRDPKVIWHEPTGRWIMAVTHGQSIGFRSSTDLVHWTLESTFGETEGRHSDGPWECPDLLPLTAPDGAIRWILIVGIGLGHDAGGSGTQYIVGDFDGHRFVNANTRETTLWLDHGRDYYATQSFFGAPTPTTISWASNWEYARHTPTTAFRGVMTLPRELSLAETSEGLRVCQIVPPSVVAKFDRVELGDVPRSGTYRIAARLTLDDDKPQGIALFGDPDPQFVFTRSRDGAVSVRSIRAGIDDIPKFAHDTDVRLAPDMALDIDIYVDNGLAELSVSGGLNWMTNLFFPANPAGGSRMIGA
jgi:fructan beta-fructosidase